MNKDILLFLGFIIAVFLLLLAFASAIDKSIRNQDTMLCESAKISGNKEYLIKCECFYQGQDIKCLQERKK